MQNNAKNNIQNEGDERMLKLIQKIHMVEVNANENWIDRVFPTRKTVFIPPLSFSGNETYPSYLVRGHHKVVISQRHLHSGVPKSSVHKMVLIKDPLKEFQHKHYSDISKINDNNHEYKKKRNGYVFKDVLRKKNRAGPRSLFYIPDQQKKHIHHFHKLNESNTNADTVYNLGTQAKNSSTPVRYTNENHNKSLQNYKEFENFLSKIKQVNDFKEARHHINHTHINHTHNHLYYYLHKLAEEKKKNLPHQQIFTDIPLFRTKHVFTKTFNTLSNISSHPTKNGNPNAKENHFHYNHSNLSHKHSKHSPTVSSTIQHKISYVQYPTKHTIRPDTTYSITQFVVHPTKHYMQPSLKYQTKDSIQPSLTYTTSAIQPYLPYTEEHKQPFVKQTKESLKYSKESQQPSLKHTRESKQPFLKDTKDPFQPSQKHEKKSQQPFLKYAEDPKQPSLTHTKESQQRSLTHTKGLQQPFLKYSKDPKQPSLQYTKESLQPFLKYAEHPKQPYVEHTKESEQPFLKYTKKSVQPFLKYTKDPIQPSLTDTKDSILPSRKYTKDSAEKGSVRYPTEGSLPPSVMYPTEESIKSSKGFKDPLNEKGTKDRKQLHLLPFVDWRDRYTSIIEKTYLKEEVPSIESKRNRIHSVEPIITEKTYLKGPSLTNASQEGIPVSNVEEKNPNNKQQTSLIGADEKEGISSTGSHKLPIYVEGKIIYSPRANKISHISPETTCMILKFY